MTRLLFGTAGVPLSAKLHTTQSGMERLRELGLDCLEIEFVRGVKMGREAAALVAQKAQEQEITLTTHAPYFINFNARELEKIEASQQRLLQTARIASICGARSVVFHTAFYLGEPPDKVYIKVKEHLQEVVMQLKRESNTVLIRPEVMGKESQFGSLDEVLALSSEIDMVAPCLDFAHWHARTGRFNSYPEFTYILDKIEEKLGRQALDDMHIHISGIAYGKHSEIKHLVLAESDLQYVELLRNLKDRGVSGVVICESPNLEGDALLLQKTYEAFP
jgi:deoxyribonuclease-4